MPIVPVTVGYLKSGAHVPPEETQLLLATLESVFCHIYSPISHYSKKLMLLLPGSHISLIIFYQVPQLKAATSLIILETVMCLETVSLRLRSWV